MEKPTSPVRACIECGKTFKGTKRRCKACRAIERNCSKCGKVFKSDSTVCSACLITERNCTECGKKFRSHMSRCPACRTRARACVGCGIVFRGLARRCGACLSSERECTDCGDMFVGLTSRCPGCRSSRRACVDCGESFRGRFLKCYACRTEERACLTCGMAFKGHRSHCASCLLKALPSEVRQAMFASANNARRARRRNAEVAGPVPAETYIAIQASGPCVYCGRPAESVDHIRPLFRGGWEHESNLVPACKSCNFSKGAKLLTDWGRSARVAHGVAHSLKVAAEYDRLTLVAA